MNLPNAVTAGRIAVTPLVAWLPLASSSSLRLAGFVLFLVAAITDYVDGQLARSRKEETDLGRLLDPIADKLLLIATFVPMFLLMRPGVRVGEGWAANAAVNAYPYQTPFGEVSLAWWLLAIVVGRELFMTVYRQAAARRGIVIAASGSAKWKTGFQWVWVGSAYFWFFTATLAAERSWNSALWNGFIHVIGLLGVLTMTGAVLLTVYSLWQYLRSYSRVFGAAAVRGGS